MILAPTHVMRPTTPSPGVWVEWTAICDCTGCTMDAVWRQKAPVTAMTRPEVDCPACGDSDTGMVAA